MTRMNACSRSLTLCVLLTAVTVVAGTRIVAAQPKEPPAADGAVSLAAVTRIPKSHEQESPFPNL